jgi:Tetratricopeptide repeat
MIIGASLESPIARIGIFAALLLFLAFLTISVLEEFTLRTFGTDGYAVEPDNLIKTISNFPRASRLRIKLARYYLEQRPPDLEAAEDQMREARRWTPHAHQYPLMLGEIRLAQGNIGGAEEAFSDALRLAPAYHIVHWRLANCLVAAGKTDQSLKHFRSVLELNPALLPLTLDLLWQASSGNVASLKYVTGNNTESKLKLASFFAAKSRPGEAVDIFSSIEPNSLKTQPSASVFLNDLIAKGEFGAAYSLWIRLKEQRSPTSPNPIWNGNFGLPILSDLKQFDWQIQDSVFAKIRIDSAEGNLDKGALEIDFLGRDTTALDQELRQIFMVRQNTNYQLSFFVKSAGFFSPATGPVTITISSRKGNSPSSLISGSSPILSGTYGWKEMAVDFRSPSANTDLIPVAISLKRQPRFVYDEPTKGRIWLDDFALRETTGK